MRELHLFAGAGGGILGGILLGHTCVCAVEIESYRRKVLLQRQRDGILPKFPIWDDIKTFDGKPWRGKVDVVAGGFPCQDISYANSKAKGINGERSGLWREMARVVREVRPRYVLVENSPALAIRGLGTVLRDLAKSGYDSEWGVFSATDEGFYHERKRLFIYANNHKDQHNGQGRPNTGGTSEGGERFRTTRKDVKEREKWFCELVAMDVVERVSSYTEGRRTFHGLANGLVRLSAIGDGQVPAVVARAWSVLSGRIEKV